MSRRSTSKRSRQSPRAGARGWAPELDLDELREDTARRAIVVAGTNLPAAPMVVAATALLFASGRSDFSENEVLAEVDKLAAELRERVGFTAAQEIAGLEAWLPIRAALRRGLERSTYGLWIKRVRPAGVAGGRLWLAAPAYDAAWFDRRYRPLAERVALQLGRELPMGTLGR